MDPGSRPRVPIRQDLWSQPLGDGMRGNRGAHRFPGRLHLGFASTTTRASPLGLPIGHGQEALLHPLAPLRRQEAWCQILLDALPPALPQGSQGRHLLADLRHGGGTGWSLRALGARFERLTRRLQVACDLGGGLGSCGRDAEGMQHAQEGLSEAPRGGVPLFPSRALGLSHVHQRRGLWDIRIRLGPSLESCKRLLGFCERLVRVSHAPAQGKRRALDDLMHEGEHIGHTEARQSLVGALHQGLGPVTDHGEAVGSQGL